MREEPAKKRVISRVHVLDEEAFDELAGRLESLIAEAAASRARLADLLGEVQGAGAGVARRRGELDQRLQLGARVLDVTGQQLRCVTNAVGELAARQKGIDREAGELRGQLGEFLERLDEARRNLDDRAAEASSAVEAQRLGADTAREQLERLLGAATSLGERVGALQERLGGAIEHFEEGIRGALGEIRSGTRDSQRATSRLDEQVFALKARVAALTESVERWLPALGPAGRAPAPPAAGAPPLEARLEDLGSRLGEVREQIAALRQSQERSGEAVAAELQKRLDDLGRTLGEPRPIGDLRERIATVAHAMEQMGHRLDDALGRLGTRLHQGLCDLERHREELAARASASEPREAEILERVAEVQDALRGIEGAVRPADLERRLGDLRDHLAALARRMDGFRPAFDELRQKQETAGAEVAAEVQARLDEIGRRLDDGLGRAAEGLAARLSAALAAVGDRSAAVADVRPAFEELRERQERTSLSIAADLRTQLEELGRRVDDARAQLGSRPVDSALLEGLGDVQEAVGRLATDVPRAAVAIDAKLSEALGRVEEREADESARVEDLRRRLGELREQVAALARGVAEVRPAIDGLRRDHQASGAAATAELQGRLADLARHVDDALGRLEARLEGPALLQRVGDVQEAVERLATQMPRATVAIEAKLSEALGRVEERGADESARIEDLRRRLGELCEQVAGLIGGVAGVRPAIDDLRQRHEAAEAAAAAELPGRLEELDRRLDVTLERLGTRLDQRLGELERRREGDPGERVLRELREQVAALARGIEAAAAAIEERGQRQDTAGAATVAEFQERLADLGRHVDDALGRLEARLEGPALLERIGDVGEAVQRLATDVPRATVAIEAKLSEALGRVEERGADESARIEDLRRRLGELGEQVAGLIGGVAGVRPAIDGLQHRHEAAHASVAAGLHRDLDELGRRLDQTLGRAFEALGARLSQVLPNAQDQGAVERAEVGALQRQLGELGDRVAELVGGFAGIGPAIDELRQQRETSGSPVATELLNRVEELGRRLEDNLERLRSHLGKPGAFDRAVEVIEARLSRVEDLGAEEGVQVEGLHGRLGELQEQIASLLRNVAGVRPAIDDLRQAQKTSAASVAEQLQRRVDELRRQLEESVGRLAIKPADPQLLERLGEVQGGVERLETQMPRVADALDARLSQALTRVEDRGTAAEDRLEGLQGDLGELRKQIAALLQGVAPLRPAIDDVRQRQERSAVAGTAELQGRLEELRRHLDEAVSRVAEAVDGRLSAALTRVEGRGAAEGARFEGLHGDLGELREQIAALLQGVVEVQKTSAASVAEQLRRRLDELGRQLDESVGQLAIRPADPHLLERLGKVQASVERLEAQMPRVAEAIDTRLSAALTRVEDRGAAEGARAERLQGDLAALREQIRALLEGVAGVRPAIDDLRQGQKASAASVAEQLQRRLDDLGRQLEAAVRGLATRPADAALLEGLSGVRESVQRLDTAMPRVAEAIGARLNDLGDLREQIAALSQGVAEGQEASAASVVERLQRRLDDLGRQLEAAVRGLATRPADGAVQERLGEVQDAVQRLDTQVPRMAEAIGARLRELSDLREQIAALSQGVAEGQETSAASIAERLQKRLEDHGRQLEVAIRGLATRPADGALLEHLGEVREAVHRLDTQMPRMAEAIGARLSAALTRVEDRNTEADDRLEGLQSDLTELREQIAALLQGVTPLRPAIDDLRQRQDRSAVAGTTEIQERLDDLGSHLDEAVSRVADAVGARLSDLPELREQIAALLQGVAGVRPAIDELRQRQERSAVAGTAELQERLADLGSHLDEGLSRVAEGLDARLGAALARVEDRGAEEGARFEGLQHDLAELREQIAALLQGVAGVRPAFDELRQRQERSAVAGTAELQGRLADLGSHLDEALSRVAEALDARLGAALARVEDRGAEEGARFEGLQGDLAELREQIAALSRSVGQSQEASAASVTEQLRRRLDELGRQLDASVGQLAFKPADPHLLERLSEVHDAVERLGVQMPRVAEALDARLGAALARVEGRGTAEGARVEGLQGDLAELREQIAALLQGVAEAQKASTASVAEQLRRRLDDLGRELEAAIHGLATRPADAALLGGLGEVREAVQSLDTRMPRLAEAIDARLSAALTRVEVRGAEAGDRLEGLHGALGELRERIAALRQGVAGVRPAIDELRQRQERSAAAGTAELQGRLADLGSRLDETLSRVTQAIDARLSAALTRVEVRGAEAGDRLEGLHGDLGELRERIAALLEGVAAVRPAIDELRQRQERSAAAGTAELQGRLADLASHLDEALSRAVQAAEARLSAAFARVEDRGAGADERLEGLRGDLGELREHIAALLQGVAGVRPAFDELRREQATSSASVVAELQRRLEDHGGRVDDAFGRAVEALGARLSAALAVLEDWSAAQGAHVENFRSQIGELRKQIAAVAQGVAGLRLVIEDLRQRHETSSVSAAADLKARLDDLGRSLQETLGQLGARLDERVGDLERLQEEELTEARSRAEDQGAAAGARFHDLRVLLEGLGAQLGGLAEGLAVVLPAVDELRHQHERSGAAAAAELQRRLEDLNRRFDEGLNQLGTRLQRGLLEQDRRGEDLVARATAPRPGETELIDRVGKVQDAVGRLEANVPRTAEVLEAGFNKRLARLEDRTAERTQVEDLQGHVGDVREQVAALAESIAGVRPAIDELRQRQERSASAAVSLLEDLGRRLGETLEELGTRLHQGLGDLERRGEEQLGEALRRVEEGAAAERAGVHDLRSHLGEVREQLAALTSSVAGVRPAFDEMRQQQEGSAAAIAAEVHGRLEELGHRLDDARGRVGAHLDQGLGELERHHEDSLSEALTRVEGWRTAGNARMASLEGRIGTMHEQVAGLAQSLGEVRPALDDLRRLQERSGGDLIDLRQRLDTSSAARATLDEHDAARAAELERQLGEVHDQIASVAQQVLPALRPSFDDLRQGQERAGTVLVARLDDVARNVADGLARLGTRLDQGLGNLERNGQELAARAASPRAGDLEIVERVGEMHGAVRRLEAHVPGSAQVAELGSRLGALHAQFASLVEGMDDLRLSQSRSGDSVTSRLDELSRRLAEALGHLGNVLVQHLGNMERERQEQEARASAPRPADAELLELVGEVQGDVRRFETQIAPVMEALGARVSEALDRVEDRGAAEAARAAELDGQVRQIREQLGSLTQRLTAVQASLDRVNVAAGAERDEGQGSFDRRFDELRGQVSAVAARVGEVPTAISDFRRRLDVQRDAVGELLERRFNELRSQVSAMAGRVAELQPALVEIRKGQERPRPPGTVAGPAPPGLEDLAGPLGEALARRLEGHLVEMAKLPERLGTASGADLAEGLGGLRDQTTALAQRVAGLQGSLDRMGSTIAGLERRQADQADDPGTFERRLDDLRGQVSAIAARVGEMPAALVDFRRRLEVQRESVGELLERRFGDLRGQISSLAGRVAEMQPVLVELRKGQEQRGPSR